MTSVLRDLSPSAVVPAIAANSDAWWAYFHHAPQADVHDEPDMLWVASGIPIAEYSVVARTTFAPDTPAEAIDAKIAAVLQYFAARGVGMQWFIGPATRPADLGLRLTAHGLKQVGDVPGMAADLEALGAGVPPPEGLVVRRVSHAGLLRQWARVAGEAFGEPEAVLRARLAVHASLGYERDAPLQRFVALLDGQPVAMSLLFLGAGVAGIYDVAIVTSAPSRHRHRRDAGAAAGGARAGLSRGRAGCLAAGRTGLPPSRLHRVLPVAFV